METRISMGVRLLILGWIVCWHMPGVAQLPEDSLWSSPTLPDTATINTWIKLAGKYDSKDAPKSLIYGKEALFYAKKTNYREGEILANYRLGRSYWRLKELELSLAHLLFFEKNRKEPPDDFHGTRSRYTRARIYRDMGEFRGAQKILIALVEESEAQQNNAQLAILYNSLGVTYENQDNLSLAMESYFKALEIRQSLKNKRRVGTAYHNIGGVYSRMQEYELAESYHRKALEIFKEFEYDKGLGAAYGALSGLERSKWAWNNSLPLAEKSNYHYTKANYQTGMATILIDFGEIHYCKGNYDLSADYAQNSLELSKKIGHYELQIEGMRRLGLIQLDNGKPDSTLLLVNQAYALAVPDWNGEDVLSNEQLQLINMKYRMISVMKLRGDAYAARSQLFEKNPEDLVAALAIYQNNMKLIEFQRQRTKGFLTKNLSEKSLKLAEAAIGVCMELHTLTSDPVYLETAFTFSEQTKSMYLYEAVLESRAKIFAGIPDSLIEQEQALTVSLNRYGTLLFEAGKNPDSDSAQVRNWRNKWTDLNSQLRDLTDNMATRYPEYYQMKYDVDVVGISQLRKQKIIGKDKSLVSYFVGTSRSYAFVISEKNINLFELPTPGVLAQHVAAFRHGIVDPWMTEIECSNGSQKSVCARLDSLRKAGTEAYATHGHLLHDLLIGALHAQEDSLTHELTIIPDGVLGYLPFHALLTQKPSDLDQFRSHPYLLKQHRISYGYSATLLSKMYEPAHSTPDKNLLAMAPYTPPKVHSIQQIIKGSASLQALPYSLSETESIHKLWGGAALIGKAATKQALIKHISDFRMVHLSTHAFANDRDPHLSGIAFYPETQHPDQSVLRLSEIYALRIPAELVVLSACESGLGVLQKGEGIISLARAFTYAGATSIVTSLWSVQDRATSTIMTSFYENLHQGKSKDESLHLAQLDYLARHDNRFAHPFFWAGFVPSGNMDPVTERGSFVWWWVLGVLGLMGVGLWWKRGTGTTDKRESGVLK